MHPDILEYASIFMFKKKQTPIFEMQSLTLKLKFFKKNQIFLSHQNFWCLKIFFKKK